MNGGEVEIRLIRSPELKRARQLVVEVMEQVYEYLLDGRTLVPEDTDRWRGAWVAMLGERIVGVGLAEEDRVSDLWLAAASRGKNIGSRLLRKLEDEIRARGHKEAKLRVVANNENAIRFYLARGWRQAERFRHEVLGCDMLVMHKCLD